MADAIDVLSVDPERGRPLRGALTGYRSVRAGRDSHRVIYRLEGGDSVVIVAIGPRLPGDRRDVYIELAALLVSSAEER